MRHVLLIVSALATLLPACPLTAQTQARTNAEDPAGHTAQRAVGAPAVEITSPRTGEVITGQIIVTGTSADATSVRVSIDNGPFLPAQGLAAWTFTLDADALSESHHSITARARSASGQIVETTAFIIVNDESPPTPDCDTIVPGAPLPFSNAAAPRRLVLSEGSTIHLEIIGHSENWFYHVPLQQMLDADPPGGFDYIVTNRFIGGHEAWQWTTPGEEGYQVIEDLVNNIQGPTIALILTSNTITFPSDAPSLDDPNYARFVEQTERLADHLYNQGAGVDMCYFSAHRMTPRKFMPSWHENLAIGDLMANAESAGKAYIKPGPEQHHLHWCCYPECYAFDFAHPNAEGAALMAEAWYNFLSDQIGACPADWDGNGAINAADVGAFLSQYFVNLDEGGLEADFDGNGVVNATDVGAFLSQYFEDLGSACAG